MPPPDMYNLATVPVRSYRSLVVSVTALVASVSLVVAIAALVASMSWPRPSLPTVQGIAERGSGFASVKEMAATGACESCGVVEAVRWELARDASSSGSDIGSTSVAMGVLGAIGGAYSGEGLGGGSQSVPKIYRVMVRMRDGSSRTLSQTSAPIVGVGAEVRVVDGVLAARG